MNTCVNCGAAISDNGICEYCGTTYRHLFTGIQDDQATYSDWRKVDDGYSFHNYPSTIDHSVRRCPKCMSVKHKKVAGFNQYKCIYCGTKFRSTKRSFKEKYA